LHPGFILLGPRRRRATIPEKEDLHTFNKKRTPAEGSHLDLRSKLNSLVPGLTSLVNNHQQLDQRKRWPARMTTSLHVRLLNKPGNQSARSESGGLGNACSQLLSCLAYRYLIRALLAFICGKAEFNHVQLSGSAKAA
jgi:hypothetical protein